MLTCAPHIFNENEYFHKRNFINRATKYILYTHHISDNNFPYNKNRINISYILTYNNNVYFNFETFLIHETLQMLFQRNALIINFYFYRYCIEYEVTKALKYCHKMPPFKKLAEGNHFP